MLKNYDGKLNFTTDAWTSPNHWAFIAFCIHMEHEGKPLTMPLDIIEVAKSHTGVEMASVFATMLEDFRLTDKKTAIDEDNELEELAREFAEEEVAYLEKVASNPNDDEADDADNDDGLVDETSGLTDMQRIDLDRTL
ncbi:hypothetical protein SCLCIDRAFT_31494 [Scleroderma citrinum Foug A]|uniref:HAT C-terminal dimerisation domain-containing protein n=1 Tax=Scleroderma citrinum Foug A TaxID=1036808 RepID=A0A0C3DBZ7_9AGAM|nr:hypothetical protein SCLCIDRAFT_31494 [Scleroderma citrinum Foug A]